MIKNQIYTAVKLLQQGKVIAFPTDTLYGLGADPRSEKSIREIFKLKQRSFKNPLPILLPKNNDLLYWIDHLILKKAGIFFKLIDLVEKFWPGPLTIVTKKSSHVSDLITANQDRVALRVPNHELTLAMLNDFNFGIIGTSANKAGQPGLIDPVEIRKNFGSELFILNGGRSPIGISSTIILVDNEIKILREGAIPIEQLKLYLS